MPLSDSLGSSAKTTVEIDYEGKAFLVKPGVIITGTVTAGLFTADAECGQPVYRLDRTNRELDTALIGMCGFADLAREAFPLDFYGVCDTGSTTTDIKVADPVLPDFAAGCEHILYLNDLVQGQPRPGYLVDEVDGGAATITLDSAMSEDPPAEGTRFRLVAKRKLLPKVSDFPDPSFGFKIGADWFVVVQGTSEIFRATATTELSKVSSGSGDCDLDIGFVAGNGNVTVNHKPRGNWDFDNATVTNILPAGADPGDLLVWDGTAWDVLPVGTDGSVLTADSGEPLGLKWI